MFPKNTKNPTPNGLRPQPMAISKEAKRMSQSLV